MSVISECRTTKELSIKFFFQEDILVHLMVGSSYGDYIMLDEFSIMVSTLCNKTMGHQ